MVQHVLYAVVRMIGNVLAVAAPLFGVGLVGTAGVVWLGYEGARTALPYLFETWLWGMIPMLLFTVTFRYQNCCVGFVSFWRHLAGHAQGLVGDVLAAVLWPISILGVHLQMTDFDLSFGIALEHAVRYWAHDHWYGSQVTIMSMTDGTVRSLEVKKPEEAIEAIRKAIQK